MEEAKLRNLKTNKEKYVNDVVEFILYNSINININIFIMFVWDWD